jgi:uncharacterized protein YmfQ (DUF2313 family)
VWFHQEVPLPHKDVLNLLFPLKDLGGVHPQDQLVEGDNLDDLELSAQGLIAELSPDTATQTLADWERVLGITPRADATTEGRRSVVLARVRARGGLSLPYFISVAAAMGRSITIEELPPNAPTYGPESRWIWKVHLAGSASQAVEFQAGISSAGDRLLEFDGEQVFEEIFLELKPAHTEVQFQYE